MSQMNEAATATTTPENNGGASLLEGNGGGNVDATLLGDAGVSAGAENGEGGADTAGSAAGASEAKTPAPAGGVEAQAGLCPLPEGASDDQKAEYNKKLRALNGTPADANGYGNFGFGDDVKIDTSSEDYQYYTKVFHDIGLNKDQAKKLLEAHHKYAMEQLEHQKRHGDDMTREYRARVRNDFVKECGGEEQFKQFNDTAVRGFKAAAQGAKLSEKDMRGILSVMGDDPRFVRIFNVIGKTYREDVLITAAAPKAQEKSFDDMFSSMFNKAANG